MYDTTELNKEIEKQRLTNEKLAVSAGLSSRTVSSIRNGESHANLLSLHKVAQALGFKLIVKFEKKAA